MAARLVREFGSLAIEEVSARRVEGWRARLGAGRDRPLSNRTRYRSLTILGGIMERARKLYGLPSSPVRHVEKLRERYDVTSFASYSPEEVHALVRAAASEQDAALFLTAAFTGLRRGELIALRRRDVDFPRSRSSHHRLGPMSAAGGGADEPRLPRAARAAVPAEKLHAYALDPGHRSGRHKARVFSSVLGIEQRDWDYLREQILARVAESPVTAIRPSPPWGAEYEVRVAVDGLNG